jgi:hypothetical protein
MATQASGSVAITGGSIAGVTITSLDANTTFQDNADPTKQMQFELSGVSGGQTSVLTVPDADTTIAGLSVAQTWTAAQTFNTGTTTIATADINGGTIDGTTQGSGTINGSIAAGGTWTAAATWTLPAVTLGGTVSGGGNQINNVIIGTSTPLAGTFTTLTSTGNAALGDAEATDTHAIKGATTLLANSASAALTVTQTGAGNAFVVEDSATPDSTAFVVDASGNVGIGKTADASVKLDVAAGAVAAIQIPSGTDSGSFRFKYTTANANSRSWLLVSDAAAYGDFHLRVSTTQTGTSYSTVLVADSSGNVMVGATAPYSATSDVLTVRRAQNARSSVLIDNQDTGASAKTSLQLESYGGGWSVYTGSTANNSNALVVNNGTSDIVTFARSTGNVGIGVTPSVALQLDRASGDARFLIRGDTAARINIRRYGDNINGAEFSLEKARGTIASPTVVQSGDQLGTFSFSGYSAAAGSHLQAVQIAAYVDGTPDSAADTTDMPGRLGIFTTPDGSATSLERLRIGSNGDILNISTGGLGYGTGSGGAVTQATSRTTGVTLDKTNGAITLVSAAGTTSWQSFTVTNSTVAATDTVALTCMKFTSPLLQQGRSESVSELQVVRPLNNPYSISQLSRQ